SALAGELSHVELAGAVVPGAAGARALLHAVFLRVEVVGLPVAPVRERERAAVGPAHRALELAIVRADPDADGEALGQESVFLRRLDTHEIASPVEARGARVGPARDVVAHAVAALAIHARKLTVAVAGARVHVTGHAGGADGAAGERRARPTASVRAGRRGWFERESALNLLLRLRSAACCSR